MAGVDAVWAAGHNWLGRGHYIPPHPPMAQGKALPKGMADDSREF